MKYFLFLFFQLSSLFAIQGSSSYPYLSGYTWAFFADWRLLGKDAGSRPESFAPEKVKLGDTVFVDFNCFDLFIRDYLPRIPDKFILITSNYGAGDAAVPGRFGELAYHPKIYAWFLQNLDREPSGNLIPIPIGIASSHWPHGNTKIFDQVIFIAKSLNMQKDIPIYINLTFRPERADCVEYFKKIGYPFTPAKSLRDYLFDLARSKFVISPRGNGLDTHRLWEALLLGCYPVVKSSTLDSLYEDLPVVVVKCWEEVTYEFLEQKYLEFRNREWNMSKLYAPYWFDKVKALQGEIRTEP
jgi:hypothetical protein